MEEEHLRLPSSNPTGEGVDFFLYDGKKARQKDMRSLSPTARTGRLQLGCMELSVS